LSEFAPVLVTLNQGMYPTISQGKFDKRQIRLAVRVNVRWSILNWRAGRPKHDLRVGLFGRLYTMQQLPVPNV